MRDVELDMHRSIDNLGKFSVSLKVDSSQQLSDEHVMELLGEMMTSSGKACLDAGADMIGHIKSCAYGLDERVCSANLTSFRIGVETQNGLDGGGFQSGQIMLHVIMHGLWDPQVRDITLGVVNCIMDSRGLEYRVIRDYFETEKRVSD